MLRKLVVFLLLPLAFFLYAIERALGDRDEENMISENETTEYDLRKKDEIVSFAVSDEEAVTIEESA